MRLGLATAGKTPAQTMGAQIRESIKREDTRSPFVKMRPGVFGLREWGAEKSSDTAQILLHEVTNTKAETIALSENRTIADVMSFNLPRTWASRPKYFIVLLSTRENLEICRNHRMAGFPDTENGRWAFVDIELGDYVSFYHSYHLYDLCQVKAKNIPNHYRLREALGTEPRDPVPVDSSTSWKAIKTKNGYLYFPYRLELNRLEETDFDPMVVFKRKFVHLGANLIPRGSLRKTHFQVPVENISRIFDDRSYSQDQLVGSGLNWFIETERRKRGKRGAAIRTIADVTSRETLLQALAKKILETIWSSVCSKFGMEESVELLSEQAVVGGEADIAAITEKSSLLIEVKRNPMAKYQKSGDVLLTRKGTEAKSQVCGYEPLWRTQKLKRGILGINNSDESKLRIMEIEDRLYLIEIDGATPLY